MKSDLVRRIPQPFLQTATPDPSPVVFDNFLAPKINECEETYSEFVAAPNLLKAFAFLDSFAISRSSLQSTLRVLYQSLV